MHADEIDTDPSLVKRLLAAQFPHLAALPIRRIASTGTDHAIYRLGDALAARLPLIAWATAQAEKEALWLPLLAPQLPVAAPQAIAIGEPGEGYPYRWALHSWLAGDSARDAPNCDLVTLARDTAALILALRCVDLRGNESPKASGGVALLRSREASVLERIPALSAIPDLDWRPVEDALRRDLAAARDWKGPRAIIHGDMSPGNLIVSNGRLSGLIDFGFFGLGDPASDLRIAWTIFRGESRRVFREALDADDALWRRARGWALEQAVMQITYYLHTNPGLVAIARETMAEAAADTS